MNKKNILLLGFMLFSLFFGAGNLIFPPFLGMESGENFIPAIAGFISTAVFIPLLAVISVSLSNNGLLAIGQRVNPLFGLIFTIVVYLSIGAFYGIPRASSVAYELGFVQVFEVESSLTLFLFTVVFFGVTYLLSVDPKKMIDRLAQILTPALLLVLTVLFVKAFTTLNYTEKHVSEKFASAPFLSGFLEGYYTMDAIAALAFGIVIINGLKTSGVTKKKDIIRGTTYAGMIAGVGLTIVYLSLSWIGRVLTYNKPVENGAEILVLATDRLFSVGGNLLFGTIVLLACLTTCVGLINACASFFNEIFPTFSYKQYVVVFVLIGLLITNLGLNTILSIATPLLVFVYPFAIVLILLSLVQYFIGESKKMYVYSMAVTTIFAVISVLDFFNVRFEAVDSVLGIFPLYENGLGWVVPTLIVATVGYVIDLTKGKVLKNAASSTIS
ncbi:LIVCS family branched-chain amino acid:cation transporter [Cerasibacillus quisquiliarum]|uniref:Branched-chain amino acid transport system carrier protein n=1 Tax=Cerasibacillus quisquiliarum TaxID=227865 RepID=A0A511UU68_9BACI|nr:branched-chain amino acid transport system II carrier protein [Cerasibacillus quisquiliarum]MBB5144989.1 LIVCS family branched-chain amino acid:cation transporter [Cerasibacillus quisquiliarum]GEN30117.1 branched-chain amino acid transport system carrier protein [Cerasibacillus quisquiliarum]